MIQCNDFDFVTARRVDTLDNLGQSLHVGGAIRYDQNIALRIRGKMALLRHQRAQYRYKLGSRYTFQFDDLGDNFVSLTGRTIRYQR